MKENTKVSKNYLKMDPSTVEAILNQSTPRFSSEVKIFHGLSSVYKKLNRNFSGVYAPKIENVKGGRKCKFFWNDEADRSFEYLKKRIENQPNFGFS